MKDYLKMSDLFTCSVIRGLNVHGPSIHGENGEFFACTYSNDVADYAAHAINSHDELVQMNQELLAALELARNDTFYVSSGFAHAAWRCQQAKDAILVIDAAIAKAKGGAA